MLKGGCFVTNGRPLSRPKARAKTMSEEVVVVGCIRPAKPKTYLQFISGSVSASVYEYLINLIIE